MKRLLVIFAILGFTASARAGLLIEPYLAYDMTTVNATLSAGNSDQGGKANPLDIGLRLGYVSFLGFFVAGDYQMAQETSYKYSANFADGKLSRTQGWLDVGYKFPFLLRVWAGYALMNEMHIKDSSGTDAKFTGGTATKLGVGFTPLPLVEVNLEYLMNSSYGTWESGGTSGDVSKSFSTLSGNSLQIGVSLPLDL